MPVIINDCVKENTMFFEINGKCRSLTKVLNNFELCCEKVNAQIEYINTQIKMLTGQTKITYLPTPSVEVVYKYYPSIKIIFKQTYLPTNKGQVNGYYDSKTIMMNRNRRDQLIISDNISPEARARSNERYSALIERRRLNGWN